MTPLPILSVADSTNIGVLRRNNLNIDKQQGCENLDNKSCHGCIASSWKQRFVDSAIAIAIGF